MGSHPQSEKVNDVLLQVEFGCLSSHFRVGDGAS